MLAEWEHALISIYFFCGTKDQDCWTELDMLATCKDGRSLAGAE